MAVAEATEQPAAPAKKAAKSQFAKQQERLAYYLLAPTLVLIFLVAASLISDVVRVP